MEKAVIQVQGLALNLPVLLAATDPTYTSSVTDETTPVPSSASESGKEYGSEENYKTAS
ncbi:hypothetical protein K435DRAFT_872590 [Dendrothele bispora CBS 962.96]|uniref:Uncharacterized protein n=1 Tax=Dendrothele bispora (strain CBS 962.96) TaxID=1314807 RepID=A0A4V4HC77_DENBC|nr:hypothetical protein K435DRAFT_872590 [Dendrothele bispora CBS 962.96]